MTGRLWCHRGALARCCVAAVIIYCMFRVLYRTDRDETAEETNRLSGPRQHPCRADMEVNLLPPMSNDFNTMLRDLFSYLTQPHPKACRKVLKFGGMAMLNLATGEPPFADGHKFVCADPEFSILTSEDCLVYSFGISEDWSFDWNMEDLGCVVYAFDPSINTTSGSQNGTVMFLQYGIGEHDHENSLGWQIRTLDTFNSRLRHTNRTIQYLKIDVEGSEWPTLRQQLSHENSVLARSVEQVGIELHFGRHLPRKEHALFYMEVYQTFLRLQELHFYVFSYDANFGGALPVTIPGLPYNVSSAVEVAWIKSKCVSVASDAG